MSMDGEDIMTIQAEPRRCNSPDAYDIMAIPKTETVEAIEPLLPGNIYTDQIYPCRSQQISKGQTVPSSDNPAAS